MIQWVCHGRCSFLVRLERNERDTLVVFKGEGWGGGGEGNLYSSETEKDALLTFLIFEILSLDEGTPLFWEQAVAKGEKKLRPITSEPVTISKRTSLFRGHFLHSKRVSAERRFHCRSKQIEL